MYMLLFYYQYYYFYYYIFTNNCAVPVNNDGKLKSISETC